MFDIFLDAAKGDEAARAHVVWLLGKPAVWFVIAKWIVVIGGALWIGYAFARTRKWLWLMGGIVVCAACAWLMWTLTAQARFGYLDSSLQGVGRLRLFGAATDLFALGVIAVLVRRLIKRPR